MYKIGRYWQFIIAIFAFFALADIAVSAPNFPRLTGRVVDDANILSSTDVNKLEQVLAQHETETSNQLVVVTIASLQGLAIEEYGYQLGRAWGIGQKGKNNGVLLIIAPKDRQVRIEVGYGLEGTLTDAITSQIIQTIILPKFRAKDYAGGIGEGVSAIIAVVGGKPIAAVAKNTVSSGDNGGNGYLILLAFLLLWVIVFKIFGKGGGGFGGGFGGRRGGGGGFSGGGGSFGGGGSSGKW